MEKTSIIRQNVFPILAAFIWGTSFVAQSMGADYVPAFTFNASRAAVAALALLGVCFLFRRLPRRDTEDCAAKKEPAVSHSRRDLLVGGISCGTVLTVATNLQQLGIETTTAGKAGFITALYIVIVPLMGLFLHKKAPLTVWAGVAAAVAGLYFLCIQDGFSISKGDFYILLCSFGFSAHILLIDHFTQKVDGIALSCVQFLVVAVLSAIGMLLFETPTLEGLHMGLWAILYVGIFSSGVAYTLQILAQKDSNPTVVSLLLSLESLFATVSGALILHDRMSGREYLGCGLMLAAVVLAQLPEKKARPAVRTVDE